MQYCAWLLLFLLRASRCLVLESIAICLFMEPCRYVMEDIAALYQEKELYKFFNFEINGDVLFAADNRLDIHVSADLKKLFVTQEVCGWRYVRVARLLGFGLRGTVLVAGLRKPKMSALKEDCVFWKKEGSG